MTEHERSEIVGLTAVVTEMDKKLGVLIASTDLRIRHIEEICNERHALSTNAINSLSQDTRSTERFTDKLKGMAAPIALILAAAAVLVNLVY